jgi:Ion channel
MTVADARRPAVPDRPAQFRYGAVFLLILILLMFAIVAPDADWARAVDIALSGAALTVAVATSRARGQVRRVRALVVAGAALVVVIGIATGLFSEKVAFAVLTLLEASIPIALIGGLLRLVRESGVAFQAVAGALSIYLLVGLLFASIVGFIAHVESGPYFLQGGNVSDGDRVYYSFTVLTTTGFGDYTAATPLGHALAVLEMLTGQLYLVTVIGILIGNFAGRKR